MGEPPGEMEIEIAGLRLVVDLLHAQKTGFYLDQLAHYETVARHAPGRRVLDCFTNQGAFALACARAGAAKVTAVEASAENIANAQRNGERNKLPVEWIEQDVFQFLRAAEKAEAEYDLIILDPPRPSPKRKADCATRCADIASCTCARSSCSRATDCSRRSPARIM